MHPFATYLEAVKEDVQKFIPRNLGVHDSFLFLWCLWNSGPIKHSIENRAERSVIEFVDSLDGDLVRGVLDSLNFLIGETILSSGIELYPS